MTGIEFIRSLLSSLLYNLLTPQILLPNLLLGIVTSLSGGYLLRKLSTVKEAGIIVLRHHLIHFLLITFLGVVVISPLPVGGTEGFIKMVSFYLLFVVLAVCAFMDEQTHYVLFGLVFSGLFSQILMLIVFVKVGFLDVKLVFGVSFWMAVTVIALLCLIRAYSPGDMGLIYMCLVGFVILNEESYLDATVIMLLVAFVTDVGRHLFFLPRYIREKRSLRFPFLLHITIGFCMATFLIF